MNEKTKLYSLKEGVKVIFETPDDARYWFGYYNYCPIDDSGKCLLAHRWISKDAEREFEQADTIDVGWFNIEDGSWHYIATTRACNWQQGAMAQWIHLDDQQRIIFNDAENGRYISKVYNIDGTHYKTLPMAIYGIDERKGISITMNFERAYWCRAYHYQYIRNEKYDDKITDVDGIYRLDLNSGAINKIIDIDAIIQYGYEPEFKDAKHWVEHIMLSPSGNKFAFYHRFDGGQGYRTRCFIADMEGKILCMLGNWKSHSWSHLGWLDDNSFVIYGVARKTLGNAYSAVTLNTGRFGKLIRKAYRALVAKHVSPQAHNKLAAGNGYEIYTVDGSYLGIHDAGTLINDGHPSFTDDGKIMLTDTYAYDGEYRHLLLYKTENKKVIEIGKFRSPINDTSYRSDLHPRFGRSNNVIIVDSAHTGKHGMVVLKLEKEIDSYEPKN